MRAIAGPACAPAPINQLDVPTFVGPKARRGPANIHVAKSSGALHPSRARLLHTPALRSQSAATASGAARLCRSHWFVSGMISVSCANKARRYIQASKSPARSSVLHVLHRARDAGIGLGSNRNSDSNSTTTMGPATASRADDPDDDDY